MIDICIYEENKDDWWTQFANAREFFDFMKEEFPGFQYDNQKSNTTSAHYQHGNVEIVARGI